MNWLRSNGIAFAQGYLLGRPGEDTVFSGLDPARPGPTVAIANTARDSLVVRYAAPSVLET
jgi:EAL domain-containing protein (putative c-di-GMP-specific phosphodiesterase class I)